MEVDYKTPSSSDPTKIDRRREGYSLQGAAYPHAAGMAIGETIKRAIFTFLNSEGSMGKEQCPPGILVAMGMEFRWPPTGDFSPLTPKNLPHSIKASAPRRHAG